ncbi:MAG: methionyl-tRNA formyltransferase [Planctomycetes bacterium]|nr:methionyl-tRNA formyltransferase [Planctomycetota bacterium]
MRIVFLGSPPFATPVLRCLLESKQHEITGLVTPPDRPRGRGRSIQESPLVSLAKAQGVPVLQPKTTKDLEFEAALQALRPDVLCVASYGEILRQNILDLAPHGALNVHGSLLPRWRGASPVQAAILAGDAETGISIQRMVLQLDAGDIVHEVRTAIEADENAGELAERLAHLGGPALLEALEMVQQGRAQYTPQAIDHVTVCRKVQKQEGSLDFQRDADDLLRQIRAMNPWPGAFCHLPNHKRLVVLKARLGESAEPFDAPNAPGTLLDSTRFLVATNTHPLELEQVKPEGKGAMAGVDFLRGAHFEAGTLLFDSPSVH